MKNILIIAGLDPTGNAGLLADVGVVHDYKFSSFAVTTALTAQNDGEFLDFSQTSTSHLADLEKLILKEKLYAVKIGMLGSKTATKFVVNLVKKIKQKTPGCPVVWDPVFFSSSGGELTRKNARKLAIKELLPLIDIITPNVPEICYLIGINDSKSLDCKTTSLKFYKKFRTLLYLKGGHTNSPSKDYFYDGKIFRELKSRKLKQSRRGTGCLLATAIACELAGGKKMAKAVLFAKKYVWEKIAAAG